MDVIHHGNDQIPKPNLILMDNKLHNSPSILLGYTNEDLLFRTHPTNNTSNLTSVNMNRFDMNISCQSNTILKPSINTQYQRKY